MMHKTLTLVPKIGDQIYVPTALHVSHGRDDFRGGLATVSVVEGGISGGKKVPFVSVVENPGVSYNWEFLSQKQAELARRFGIARAHPNPDWRPEFNEP